MKWKLLACLLPVLILTPAFGQEAEDPAAEAIKAARLAMEAKLKIGDLLREKGDLDGALRHYREAIEIFEQAVRHLEARPRPAASSDAPFEKGTPVPAEARQDAIERALRWLARHQDEDGRWDADDFMKHDPGQDRCTGSGKQLFDVGVTGLSLLAFLGAGHTDRGSEDENPFAKTVRLGLRFLIQNQAEDGCFGTRATHSFMYNHVLATLALCETHALTRNPRYKAPAQAGLDFIAKARNPYMAWRYEPRSGENDTSVTAWCVLALKSGRFAGLEVDPDAFEGARAWIDKMTDPEFGQVGYNYPGGTCARVDGMQDKFPPHKSAAMTAAGITVRMLCGEDPRASELIRKGAHLCLERAPTWNTKDGSIDMYYWFWGTQAMFRIGGPQWKNWVTHLSRALLAEQRNGGAADGSWDPAGAWGSEGGRVYSTALMTLCLEHYYRYGHALANR